MYRWTMVRKPRQNITITVGKQKLRLPREEMPQPEKTQFFAYCFYCGAPKHSRNFCPLTYCIGCKQYGHYYKMCSSPIDS